MKKLIVRSHLSLGDVVCMTAAVRELHRQFPGVYATDVRTPFPAVWQFNPEITPISDDDPEATQLDLHYDKHEYVTVNKSNRHPIHLIEGYCQGLADQLQIPSLRPRELKGHIHLSADELHWMSAPHEHFNAQKYWIICLGGGNKDFTLKWYIPEYTQQIVDHFRGRLQFVQVGVKDDPWHWHPNLTGVIDLRGKTDARQLIRLVHSSMGVLSGITAVMHLAAAVPVPKWQWRPRAWWWRAAASRGLGSVIRIIASWKPWARCHVARSAAVGINAQSRCTTEKMVACASASSTDTPSACG